MDYKIFYEITAVLALAGLISALVSLLKQPSIVAFILTGLVVGPFGYAQLSQTGTLDALGQIGITLLLFMVGLELDFKRVRELGKAAVFTGLGQIVFTLILGFLLASLWGFKAAPALYIATALTFSSTIIVVKLLAAKKDLQSLYGRIVVGFLIVQDFVALGILLFLGASQNSGVFSGLPGWQQALVVAVKALIITLFLIWVSSKVFPRLLGIFGKSEELLLIFSVAWALGLAAFMSLPVVGFSLEIGGFLAGLALANSVARIEISAKVKSIRDFFLILFFIVFGAKLVFAGVSGILLPALMFSAYVLIGQPILMLFIMGYLGYKPRTAFFAAVTVAQLSEFSFVLVALGSRLGHISDQVVALVTLVGLITITLSSYLILYTHWFYSRLRKFLNWFDFKKGAAEKHLRNLQLSGHTVLIGAHRLGSHLLASLKKQDRPLIVVDFDPEVAEGLEMEHFNAVCGDITDPYIQDLVNLEKARLIISTIPDFDDNVELLEMLNLRTAKRKQKPKLIFAAQSEAEARHLYQKEIDYVISPHFIGGLHLAKILEEQNFGKSLGRLRESHLKIMNRRA